MTDADLNQTSAHPLVACATLLAAALILLVSRRHVIVPFLIGGLLIPMDQIVVIGPLHFPMIRLLILAGWARLGVTKDRSGRVSSRVKMTSLDWIVIVYAASDFVGYIALWDFAASAFVNRCGAALMVIGIYFLLRRLLYTERDVVLAIKVLGGVAAVTALIMLLEHHTGQNPYAYLGGSRAWTRGVLMIREAKIRAMGPFQHPILAGSFGGITFPLFMGLWIKKQRLYAVVGMVSATVIAVMSASSTPIMAYVLALVAMTCWVIRNYLRFVRWCLALSLLAFHLTMKAPVWALIQRIDVVGGSSGFHRFNLVDQTIRHFGEWWLFGVKDTGSWGPDLWDHANQYVAVGTNSGILPLIAFIGIIVFGFKGVGVAQRRRKSDTDRRFVWALGASILANTIAFFGISYVDQIVLVWWGVLAMVQTMAGTGDRGSNDKSSQRSTARPHVKLNPAPDNTGRAPAGAAAYLSSQNILRLS